ncbi:hypothetical protein B9Z55_012050 [Caenorhabditis nigoni]|uniref:Miro domain-containing protein n=1 Tax=Caenorhabditis nigoni TaxID=1611254 RepID=A0A2G5TVN4_9PELO|nr:hypothetical protein B9Z55_012050 [Caenorhabditis nigoni]
MRHEGQKGKILILGPQKAGKTTLSRFLADYAEEHESAKRGTKPKVDKEKKMEFEFNTPYMPTKGARIQEFESHELLDSDRGKIIKDIEIQLWDVSGDRNNILLVGNFLISSTVTEIYELKVGASSLLRYEDCWPAIKEDADGVILVANPEEHNGKDLQIWFTEFVEKENISLNRVMVILNEQGSKKTNHEQISSFEILPKLRGVHHSAHHFASESAQMKVEVNDFMASVLGIVAGEDDKKSDDVHDEGVDEDDF